MFVRIYRLDVPQTLYVQLILEEDGLQTPGCNPERPTYSSPLPHRAHQSGGRCSSLAAALLPLGTQSEHRAPQLIWLQLFCLSALNPSAGRSSSLWPPLSALLTFSHLITKHRKGKQKRERHVSITEESHNAPPLMRAICSHPLSYHIKQYNKSTRVSTRTTLQIRTRK